MCSLVLIEFFIKKPLLGDSGMILSRDLLLQAFNSARFYCRGQEISKDDFSWDFYQQNKTVYAAVDSRLVEKDDVFFALKGESTDGHKFLVDAFDAGASAFVVSCDIAHCLSVLSAKKLENRLIIKVDDTYQALFALTKAWRSLLTMPTVGITGSIGKTSTKEILRSILQQANISFYVSMKNQNTFTGLCLNILRVPFDCQVAAFEVGMSKPGEMEIKADILRPSIGLITCIAHSHLEDVGSLSGVAQEKRKLFKYFSPQDIGIIFGDQTLLLDAYYTHPIAKFGFKIKNQVQARKVKTMSLDDGSIVTEFILKWYGEKTSIRMPGNHVGMVHNALAASTIAYFLKIPLDVVVAGVQNYHGFENRFELRQISRKRGVIVSDCYNANPESMRAAIVAFDKMKSKGKKIAVLGDMLGLGEKEAFWHRQIGRLLAKASTIEAVVLVGERAKNIALTAPKYLTVELASDWQSARTKLEDLLPMQDALVLVKASHDMVLNKVVDAVSEAVS